MMNFYNKKNFICLVSLAFCLSTQCFASQPNYEIKAKYTKEDANITGSELTFEYKPQSLYEISCQIGHITDIVLKPGETIVYLGAGDTSQWMVDNTTVNDTAHVYVKPKVTDISTNLIINTDIRSYRLVLNSQDKYCPIVRWQFTDEERIENEKSYRSQKIQNGRYLSSTSNNNKVKLNFNYKLTNLKKVEPFYQPVSIYDDGIHTYIKMQQNNRYDLPIVYHIGKDKSMTLVNYRIRGNLFICDRIFDHGRIVYTSKSSIDFIPSKKKED